MFFPGKILSISRSEIILCYLHRSEVCGVRCAVVPPEFSVNMHEENELVDGLASIKSIFLRTDFHC